MKHISYIPAMSTGTAGNLFRKNKHLFDQIPVRFYDKNEMGRYVYPFFLITAGHFLKQKNFSDDLGLDLKNNVILGDSGGFQIASGALKYTNELVEQIFNWLENNSNIAINLDIPPQLTLKGKFQESMRLSEQNFRYFDKHQTGKTKFLNVLQGHDLNEKRAWYKMASKFKTFSGWSVGGAGNSIHKMVHSLITLLENGELHDSSNKFLHILGTSKTRDFLLLEQLQKSLYETDSSIQVMTDSSTPGKTAAFGNYFFSMNWDKLNYKNLKFSNKQEFDETKKLIAVTEFDFEYLKNITYKEIQNWSSESYGIIILHNLYFALDVIRTIKTIVHTDKYHKEMALSADINLMLDSIDELVKSKNREKVYNKYFNLYNRLSQTDTIVNEEATNNFFKF